MTAVNSPSFTTGYLAREGKTAEATVRNWANKGLISCIYDSAGRRLFDDTALQFVRERAKTRAGQLGR
jgi:DNA-binding transcriptional MerR regulator